MSQGNCQSSDNTQRSENSQNQSVTKRQTHMGYQPSTGHLSQQQNPVKGNLDISVNFFYCI